MLNFVAIGAINVALRVTGEFHILQKNMSIASFRFAPSIYTGKLSSFFVVIFTLSTMAFVAVYGLHSMAIDDYRSRREAAGYQRVKVNVIMIY